MKNNKILVLLSCIILLSTIAFAQNNKPVQPRSGMSPQQANQTRIMYNTTQDPLKVQFYTSSNSVIGKPIPILPKATIRIPQNAVNVVIIISSNSFTPAMYMYPTTSSQNIVKLQSGGYGIFPVKNPKK